MRDLYGYYRDLFSRYPDPATVRSLNGVIVVTGDPEGAREIYSAKPDTFGTFGVEALAPLVGRRSLLVISGATHASRRKLMMPPFHSSLAYEGSGSIPNLYALTCIPRFADLAHDASLSFPGEAECTPIGSLPVSTSCSLC